MRPCWSLSRLPVGDGLPINLYRMQLSAPVIAVGLTGWFSSHGTKLSG
jgi:hypothetical protein